LSRYAEAGKAETMNNIKENYWKDKGKKTQRLRGKERGAVLFLGIILYVYLYNPIHQ
jgi:hypothetical protein